MNHERIRRLEAALWGEDDPERRARLQADLAEAREESLTGAADPRISHECEEQPGPVRQSPS